MALFEEEPNSAFLKSLIPSESHGHSQGKEWSGQPAGFRRLTSLGAICGLPRLAVVGGGLSVPVSEACCNCCCFAANAAAMLLRR